jgi:hypothetical protein
MPSALAWNTIKESVAGEYEVLFPGEAKTFQVYDEKTETYRILVVWCDPDDTGTCIYEFERSEEINMATDPQELARLCSEMEPWEEVEHGTCFVADTFGAPEMEVALFIGHQLTMRPS